jgi:PAS domain S-box-containing protein
MPHPHLNTKGPQSAGNSALSLNEDRLRASLQFIVNLIAADVESREVQDWLVEEIGRILGLGAVTLYLLDRTDARMLMKKSWSLGKGLTSQLVPFEGDSLVARAMRAGCPQEDRCKSNEVMINIPLIVEGEGTIGSIEVQSPTEKVDSDLLVVMSEAIAHAFTRAWQIRCAQETIDSLQTIQGQLLYSRNTLRALFDSSPTSIYIVDFEYNLIAVNLSRADLTGKSPKEIVGKPCFAALHQREAPCPDCLVGETLRNGTHTRRVERHLEERGDTIEIEVSTFPIWNEDREIIQSFLFEEDVTERRHLQASLAQSEKLAAVGQLAAGVAHEINNPLAIILANAQLLQRRLPNHELDLQEMVELILQASERASQAVRDLLDFARRERYEPALIDINATIQRTLALMQHELSSRPITLNFDPEEDLPSVLASQDHLQGVWLNLLVNAIDAIDPEPGEIKISTRRIGEEVHIVVADSGQGIPPEHISRIYEPFFTTKEPGCGTGLGLSVCHQVITQHGGRILVSSIPNEGATFTVVLPIP